MSRGAGPGEHLAAVGRILSPHGIAGLLKVLPLTDYPDRCRDLKEVACELRGIRSTVMVERATLHGRYWLIKFEGIDTREEAAALRGALILIRTDERVPLPDGSYYHDQLIGLKLYNTEGECLGQVKDIVPGAAHDHYLIGRDAPGEKDFLLPAVKAFILEIDLSGGRIIAEPPAGLMELER